MSDDVDLYEDLPLLNFGESISKIEEERQYFKNQLIEKEKDLHEIKEQFLSLEKTKKILEENISSLYKTAVSEIKRKDRVIEELRREKDALIFRRKERASCNKSFSNIPKKLDNNHQHKPALPTKATSISVEKSVESVKLSDKSKSILDIKNHNESTYGIAIVSSELDVCESESSLNCALVDETTGDYRKMLNKVKTSMNSVCESFCVKLDDGASDKSSCSSERSYRSSHHSRAREQSKENKVFKNDCDRRSLSSEDRRENRHALNEYYSQYSSSSRSRHRSPHNRHRSSRSHNEKGRRDDRSWDHDEDRKHRDFYKNVDARDSKISDELRRKHHSHSRRSPSPYNSRRYTHNPISRYSTRHLNSKFNRGMKSPSQNVRLAAQLKSKYSKAMRERSMTRTPVRVLRKTLSENVNNKESNSECVNMQNTAHVDIRELKENVQSINQKNKCANDKIETQSKSNKSQHVSSESQNVSCEKSVYQKFKVQNNYEPLIPQKHSHNINNYYENNKNALSDKYNEIIDNDLEKSSRSYVVKFNNNKKIKQDSLAVDTPCQVDGKLNISNEETTMELKAVLSHSDNYFTPPRERNSRISENESVLTRNEDSAKSSGKGEKCQFSPQLSKTPRCNTLVPLKISPSFEDPAIVKDTKFSLSVFNEQCEFQSRRRRSVKLRVTELKSIADNSIEKSNDETLNFQISEKADVVNIVSSKSVNNDSLGDYAPENKMTCVSEETVHLKNESEQNQGTVAESVAIDIAEISENNDINQQKPTLDEGELGRSDLKYVNVLHNSSIEKVSKKRSPNKKRKLDSICEELKANLERKKGPAHVEFAPVHDTSESCPQNPTSKSNDEDVDKDKNIHSAEVHSDKFSKLEDLSSEKLKQPPNRIIIPKRRRKVHNLQDNEVQVLSQVKSRIS